MGNSASGGCAPQCCGVMNFAEHDDGGARNAKKSTAISIPDMDNSSITTGHNGRFGATPPSRRNSEGGMIYIEAREARESGEVCTSERGARRAARYKRKHTSIMLEGMTNVQGGGPNGLDVMAADSFSSISDAGVSVLTGTRFLDQGGGERVAPPTSTDDMSVDSFLNDTATDYDICRTMLRKRLEDEARDDAQDETRDDV